MNKELKETSLSISWVLRNSSELEIEEDDKHIEVKLGVVVVMGTMHSR